MKHCPNPDCRGLAKFGFAPEYEDSSIVCADCGADLERGPSPGLVPDEESSWERANYVPNPELVLVPVLRVVSVADVAVAESLLLDANIKYLARGKHIQDLFGMGRLVGANPIIEPVEFLVAEADAPAAREILANLGYDASGRSGEIDASV